MCPRSIAGVSSSRATSGFPQYCASTCARFGCTWHASCVDSKTKQNKKNIASGTRSPFLYLQTSDIMGANHPWAGRSALSPPVSTLIPHPPPPNQRGWVATPTMCHCTDLGRSRIMCATDCMRKWTSPSCSTTQDLFFQTHNYARTSDLQSTGLHSAATHYEHRHYSSVCKWQSVNNIVGFWCYCLENLANELFKVHYNVCV